MQCEAPVRARLYGDRVLAVFAIFEADRDTLERRTISKFCDQTRNAAQVIFGFVYGGILGRSLCVQSCGE